MNKITLKNKWKLQVLLLDIHHYTEGQEMSGYSNNLYVTSYLFQDSYAGTTVSEKPITQDTCLYEVHHQVIVTK